MQIKLNPSYAVVYDKIETLHKYDITQEKRTPKGHLSTVSKRKMKLSISNLNFMANNKKAYNPKFKSYYNWKLNFITLTLPAKQRISDSEFKRRYLGHFIVELVKKYSPSGYVYRLETQGNGNIHAHILFDVYIDYRQLNLMWNRILSKGHFIDEFEKLNGHRNPNSTDVHSLSKIANVQNYLMKYMGKNDKERRPVSGKQWGCSDNLLNSIKAEFTPEMDEILTEAIKSGEVEFFRPEDMPHIQIFFFKDYWPPELTRTFANQFNIWLTKLFKVPTVQQTMLEFKTPDLE